MAKPNVITKTARSAWSNKGKILLASFVIGSTLLVAAGVAATLIFFPPALPAVLGFSVLGWAPFAFAAAFSFPAQIAALTGIAAGAAFVGSVVVGAVGALIPSLFNKIKSVFSKGKNASAANENPVEGEELTPVSPALGQVSQADPTVVAQNDTVAANPAAPKFPAATSTPAATYTAADADADAEQPAAPAL